MVDTTRPDGRRVSIERDALFLDDLTRDDLELSVQNIQYGEVKHSNLVGHTSKPLPHPRTKFPKGTRTFS